MPYFNVGQYRAKITDLTTGVSKNKNTPFVQVVFVPEALLDIANDTEMHLDVEYERDIKMWLTEAAAPRTCEDLRRIGYTGTDFSEINSGAAHDALIGADIRVRCEHEEYEGKTYDRWYLSSGGGSIAKEPLNDAGVRKLNALFGNVLKSTKVEDNSNGAAERNKPLAPGTDDALEKEVAAAQAVDGDIPF